MSFETAALVLAWLVIVVLAFAMAGMLAMIRRLEASQAQLSGSLANAVPGSARAQASARFTPLERPYAFVLTTSASCQACAELMPRFREFVRDHEDAGEFHVLSADSESGTGQPGLDVTVDAAAFAALSPGYTPGLVVIDRTGAVVDVGPGGDLASVHRWIERQQPSRATEERP